MFSRGDTKSIQLLLRSLATFAAASGLVANTGKSDIYFCNPDPRAKQEILETSGFKEGTLPFKYLGVKVGTKKLSMDDCQLLIDNLVRKIRMWGSRKMSYAARAQLVNPVLLSMLGLNFHST